MCKLCADFQAVNSEAFGENLLNMINLGTLSLMVSVGHRTSLFDTMSGMGYVTSGELASKAGLNERYVREWLGAMAAGGIVDITDDGNRFHLPEEHAAFLTRKAGADNIAVFSQYVATLGSVEDRIVDCFKNGGGVAYEEYNRFHEVMAEDSGQSVLSSLMSSILPLIPGIRGRLEDGIDVLDIGCGSGRALLIMAKAFPNSRFFGYDLCEEPILSARMEAAKMGLTNIQFHVKDLTHYRHEKRFDLITAFDAIHDQARPDYVLKAIADALKQDGVFLMQDIDASSNVRNNLDHPMGALLYSVSCMHCMTVSLAQGGLGLGAMWGTEKASEMLKDAGFNEVEIHRLPHDVQNCYYVIRK